MSTFSNPPWWKSASIYQIYPASFLDTNNDGIGDLPGIISKVPYLHSLGVDAVWLSPIYKSPQADMGYDISDYFSIHPPYGTLADVEKLIAELHARGMKLVMDLVVNHTSNDHEWFKESKASKKNPKRDWYTWRKGREYSVIDGSNGTTRVVKEPPNNWRGVFGGSAWTLDETTGEYYLHLFSPEQPDLNWENPTVRKMAYFVMKWWLDKGVDGFRMDVINLISKHPKLPDAPITAPGEKYQWGTKYYVNGPRLHEFLQEMRREVLSKYDGIAIGEMPWVDDENEVLKSVARGRRELDMIFQFDIVDIDIPAASPTKFARLDWPLARLKAILSKWQGLMEDRDGWNTLFLENHDQPRSISRYVQYTNPKHRVTAAKMLATLLALQKGTLFIFQGQEIGMGNVPTSWGIEEFKDIETLKYYAEVKESTKNDPFKMAEAMKNIHFRARDNARTPMQWDNTPHAGFTSAASTPWMRVNDEYETVNAAAQVHNPSSIYHHWNKVLELRKKYPELFIDGVFTMLAPSHDSVMLYQRVANGGEKAVVALNFTEKQVSIDLVAEGVVSTETKHLTVLLDNHEASNPEKSYVKRRDLHEGQLRLQEFEALVVILDG